jgi:hypothetical protein
MVTSLRSKWAAGQAVRAGLALEGASRTSFTVAGASEIGGRVKLVLDLTDEQRSRRPIFRLKAIRNPDAGLSWIEILGVSCDQQRVVDGELFPLIPQPTHQLD